MFRYVWAFYFWTAVVIHDVSADDRVAELPREKFQEFSDLHNLDIMLPKTQDHDLFLMSAVPQEYHVHQSEFSFMKGRGGHSLTLNPAASIAWRFLDGGLPRVGKFTQATVGTHVRAYYGELCQSAANSTPLKFDGRSTRSSPSSAYHFSPPFPEFTGRFVLVIERVQDDPDDLFVIFTDAFATKCAIVQPIGKFPAASHGMWSMPARTFRDPGSKILVRGSSAFNIIATDLCHHGRGQPDIMSPSKSPFVMEVGRKLFLKVDTRRMHAQALQITVTVGPDAPPSQPVLISTSVFSTWTGICRKVAKDSFWDPTTRQTATVHVDLQRVQPDWNLYLYLGTDDFATGTLLVTVRYDSSVPPDLNLIQNSATSDEVLQNLFQGIVGDFVPKIGAGVAETNDKTVIPTNEFVELADVRSASPLNRQFTQLKFNNLRDGNVMLLSVSPGFADSSFKFQYNAASGSKSLAISASKPFAWDRLDELSGEPVAGMFKEATRFRALRLFSGDLCPLEMKPSELVFNEGSRGVDNYFFDVKSFSEGSDIPSRFAVLVLVDTIALHDLFMTAGALSDSSGCSGVLPIGKFRQGMVGWWSMPSAAANTNHTDLFFLGSRPFAMHFTDLCDSGRGDIDIVLQRRPQKRVHLGTHIFVRIDSSALSGDEFFVTVVPTVSPPTQKVFLTVSAYDTVRKTCTPLTDTVWDPDSSRGKTIIHIRLAEGSQSSRHFILHFGTVDSENGNLVVTATVRPPYSHRFVNGDNLPSNSKVGGTVSGRHIARYIFEITSIVLTGLLILFLIAWAASALLRKYARREFMQVPVDDELHVDEDDADL
eukprot:357937_1